MAHTEYCKYSLSGFILQWRHSIQLCVAVQKSLLQGRDIPDYFINVVVDVLKGDLATTSASLEGYDYASQFINIVTLRVLRTLDKRNRSLDLVSLLNI